VDSFITAVQAQSCREIVNGGTVNIKALIAKLCGHPDAALPTCTPGPDEDMLTMVRISLRQ
jgi:hypothetical protein